MYERVTYCYNKDSMLRVLPIIIVKAHLQPF